MTTVDCRRKKLQTLHWQQPASRFVVMVWGNLMAVRP